MAAAGRLPSARADAAVPTIGRTVYLLGDTASTLTARLRSFFSPTRRCWCDECAERSSRSSRPARHADREVK